LLEDGSVGVKVRDVMLAAELEWRQVVQAHVRSYRVVVSPPGLDHDPGLAPRAEPLDVQALVSLNAAAGVTEAASDTVLSISLPYRFR
jgi:hypothetical protein